MIKDWSKPFRMEQESLVDDARTEITVEMATNDEIALVENLVLNDPCLKLKEILQIWGLSDTSVHHHLALSKVSAKLVTKHLLAVRILWKRLQTS